MEYPTDAKTLFLLGKHRELRFTLSVFKRLKAKFGVSFLNGTGFNQLDEDILPDFIYEALVDKEGVTPELIADELTMDVMPVVMEAIGTALNPKGTSANQSEKKS